MTWAAISEMDWTREEKPDLELWIGEVERYCRAIDEMRGE
jgi:hypothetical protein